MSTEKRLSAPELVDEIRSSLAATTGWIPILSGPDGPTGLPETASLSEVAQSLRKFANAPAMPAAVAQQLRRASASATAGIAADDTTAYGHLGAAYAYVVQARLATSDDTTS
ncbi:hypothetical protein STHAL_32305 [Streptomyces halstedii]|uniref:Uncharacterized protein n=1 Tax=Streptomyces halstedii TaxID=1944 RepID=A0ABS6U0R0_STRHA|nr:hypothetical protein [Streptomyces halstedii]MBV7674131.1 hypothetical protein [Streptomyces halstedii]